eukprot:4979535-Pleurochrysis_carterae.AAC.1
MQSPAAARLRALSLFWQKSSCVWLTASKLRSTSALMPKAALVWLVNVDYVHTRIYLVVRFSAFRQNAPDAFYEILSRLVSKDVAMVRVRLSDLHHAYQTSFARFSIALCCLSHALNSYRNGAHTHHTLGSARVPVKRVRFWPKPIDSCTSMHDRRNYV